MTAVASILRNDEYYDFAGFKELALAIAAEMPEKTKPTSDRIMIAQYIEPEKTKGGIILHSKTQKESQWQEPLSVIIAKGATAFKYEGAYGFEGHIPQVGDIVLTDPSASKGRYYRGLYVRILSSELVQLVVDDKDTESFY